MAQHEVEVVEDTPSPLLDRRMDLHGAKLRAYAAASVEEEQEEFELS